jgi:hypothetical protein
MLNILRNQIYIESRINVQYIINVAKGLTILQLFMSTTHVYNVAPFHH